MRSVTVRGVLALAFALTSAEAIAGPQYNDKEPATCGGSDGRNGGLQVYVTEAISSDPVAVLTEAELVQRDLGRVALEAASGEYESASIVLRSCADLIDVGVSVSGLAGEAASQMIDAENIDVRVVKYWYQAGGAWSSISKKGERRLVPELLLKDEDLVRVDRDSERNFLRLGPPDRPTYVDISIEDNVRGRLIPAWHEDVLDTKEFQRIRLVANESKQLWINLRVPASAIPGAYRGVLSVSINGNSLAEVPLLLEVLPFVLSEPSLEYSIFYRGRLVEGEGSISSEYKSEVQYRAELANLREHGVTNPNVYQSPSPRDLFGRALAIRQELGAIGRTAFLVGVPAFFEGEGHAQWLGLLRRVQQQTTAFGVREVSVFGLDEARADRLAAQQQSWREVHDLGATVFATGYKGTFDVVGSNLDYMILAGRPDEEEVRKFQEAGKRVYTYGFPQSGPENPLLFRLNYGLALWRAGVDGAMPYAYQESYQNTWNDFDHEVYRDHNFTYPVSDGVIDTIAWEGFREAVDDVRYITTLERFTDSNLASGCAEQESACQAASLARAYLDRLRDHGHSDLATMRREVVDHIRAIAGL